MRRNPYAIEVNKSRNCYSCGGFGHLAKNYRNRERIEQGRRLEYRENQNNEQRNLNREENLIVLN